MRYEITAPTTGYSGLIAGVAFTAGRALVDDPPPGAVEYFRRHGYTFAPLDAEPLTVGFTADLPPSKPAARQRKQRTSAKED
ncbi:hypothetical protein [Streptomyces chattanoogensis]|uniref:hypothetical protein n=1 Tax=Streptomyces chattanoogensis TaxID=66876 RepID=UPI00368B95E3